MGIAMNAMSGVAKQIGHGASMIAGNITLGKMNNKENKYLEAMKKAEKSRDDRIAAIRQTKYKSASAMKAQLTKAQGDYEKETKMIKDAYGKGGKQ